MKVIVTGVTQCTPEIAESIQNRVDTILRDAKLPVSYMIGSRSYPIMPATFRGDHWTIDQQRGEKDYETFVKEGFVDDYL